MPYDFNACIHTKKKKKATETEMCRDRDVQRQRESGYMWMCKAGQGNDWTGVQRSAEEWNGVDQVLL
jgi:hypothetical protein